MLNPVFLLFGQAGLVSATLYINGVRADGLRDFELEDVDVRIDASGDIHVDAPHYSVEVVEEEGIPVGDSLETDLPPSTYWLVTVDQDSSGFVVDVLLNGSLVRRVRSGEEQLILDVASYLRNGENTILVTPSGLNPTGRLEVVLGTGSNEAGTVVMGEPLVSLSLSPTANGSPAGNLTATFMVP